MLTAPRLPFPVPLGLTTGDNMEPWNSPQGQRPEPTRDFLCPHPSGLTSGGERPLCPILWVCQAQDAAGVGGKGADPDLVLGLPGQQEAL